MGSPSHGEIGVGGLEVPPELGEEEAGDKALEGVDAGRVREDHEVGVSPEPDEREVGEVDGNIVFEHFQELASALFPGREDEQPPLPGYLEERVLEVPVDELRSEERRV